MVSITDFMDFIGRAMVNVKATNVKQDWRYLENV